MFKTTSVLLRIIQKSPFGISYTNNSVAVDTLSFCVSGSAQRICELDNSQTSINLASKWHRLDNSHLKSEYLESELSRSPYLIVIEPSNRITIQMRFRDGMLEYEQSQLYCAVYAEQTYPKLRNMCSSQLAMANSTD